MDQTSFDFIKAAMIERVKAEPIFSYWVVTEQDYWDSLKTNVREESGLIVAINTGSGFRLHNLNAETLEHLEVGPIVLKSNSYFGPIRPGVLARKDILRLHEHITQREGT